MHHYLVEKSQDTAKILNEIRSGKAARDAVITKLYRDQKLRNYIKTIIYKCGGQTSDFDSVFNTTLMQFIKTVIKRKDLKLESSLQTTKSKLSGRIPNGIRPEWTGYDYSRSH